MYVYCYRSLHTASGLFALAYIDAANLSTTTP